MPPADQRSRTPAEAMLLDLTESGADLGALAAIVSDALGVLDIQERLTRYVGHDGAYGACTTPGWKFHHGEQIGRVLIGANKSAKSVAGAVETCWWAAGEHPWRQTPKPPVYGRVVTPALPGNLDEPHVQRDTIRDWCPPIWLRGGSWLRAYSIGGHSLHFANGSMVEFLSSDQEPEKHAGENRDFCWFDEELPRIIFTENMLRLARKGDEGARMGSWWMTYAPIIGHVWMEDEIYKPGVEAGWVWTADIEDNRHNLPPGFIENLEASLMEVDKTSRLRGRYGRRTGLVYDIFSADHLQDIEVLVN